MNKPIKRIDTNLSQTFINYLLFGENMVPMTPEEGGFGYMAISIWSPFEKLIRLSGAKAPAKRPISGTSGSTPSNIGMSERTRKTIKLAGTANDTKKIADIGTKLAKEATMDAGTALDRSGEAILDAGLIAAPFTEVASLVLVPIGEGMSVTGKVMKTPVHLSEGNTEEATQEAVNLAVGVATGYGIGTAIKQSKKVGLITDSYKK